MNNDKRFTVKIVVPDNFRLGKSGSNPDAEYDLKLVNTEEHYYIGEIDFIGKDAAMRYLIEAEGFSREDAESFLDSLPDSGERERRIDWGTEKKYWDFVQYWKEQQEGDINRKITEHKTEGTLSGGEGMRK